MKKNPKAFGENILATVVNLFSKHFFVSPKFLMKVLPMLRLEIPNLPFFFGIHKHGVSHPDAECILHAAEASGKIERSEFKEKGQFLWSEPRIKYKLYSNLSLAEMDATAKQLGVTLPQLERKVEVLANKYGGNPEYIEESTIKYLINKFRQPTAWLYFSGRWEIKQSSLQYKGLRQFTIGPVSVPIPDFVVELMPLQRLIFEVYVPLLAKKDEPNSERYFRINALKKAGREGNLSGEKVFLFGYILNIPKKLEDRTERFQCTMSDSWFFSNRDRRINLILDGSARASFERDLKDFTKYEIMVLGTMANDHVNVSAILKIAELPKRKRDSIVTLKDFLVA